MTYTALAGQCLADIAIEVYGDVRGVFWLIEDNPALTHAADRLYTGLVLTLRADVLNPRYRQYLTDFAPFVSTEAPDFAEGIGAWWLSEYEVRAGETPTRNIAPLATVTASSLYPNFPLPQTIVADPIVWHGWGGSGWNDFTQSQFPDWLELTWSTDQSVMGLEVVSLTDDLNYSYDPAVTGGYVPKAYTIQAHINGVWTTLVTETENSFVYRKYLFSQIITKRIRITITASVDGLYSRITQLKVLDN